LADEALTSREEAVLRVAPEQIEFFLHPQFSVMSCAGATRSKRGGLRLRSPLWYVRAGGRFGCRSIRLRLPVLTAGAGKTAKNGARVTVSWLIPPHCWSCSPTSRERCSNRAKSQQLC
jgi:hypothetical protein